MKPKSDQFQKFQAALTKVLLVSRKEMQEKLAAEKAAKRKSKKTSASGRASHDRD